MNKQKVFFQLHIRYEVDAQEKKHLAE